MIGGANRNRLLHPDALPAQGGAYALLIRLRRPLRCSIAGRADGRLDPGLHLYAGNAWGPGGIRARVARHLRTHKTRRWHIDRITAVTRPVGVIAWPGGDECAIVAQALRLPGVAVPIAGFGSTDCRSCPAHLLLLADERTVREIAHPAPGTGTLPASGVWIWPANLLTDMGFS